MRYESDAKTRKAMEAAAPRGDYLTVGELIEKLGKFPAGARVAIRDPDTDWTLPIKYLDTDDEGVVTVGSDYD